MPNRMCFLFHVTIRLKQKIMPCYNVTRTLQNVAIRFLTIPNVLFFVKDMFIICKTTSMPKPDILILTVFTTSYIFYIHT